MKQISFFLFFLVCFSSFYSQSNTSTDKKPILIAIEDSLRERLIWENDSAWLSKVLTRIKKIYNPNSKAKYKLDKIEKIYFSINNNSLINRNNKNGFFIDTSCNIIFGDKLLKIKGNDNSEVNNSKQKFYIKYYLSKIEQEAILIAIEDSLRERIQTKYDSTWLNLNLEFQQNAFKIPNIYYKLVKIGKRDFVEGPHADIPSPKKKSIVNFKFGDSTYLISGEKIYTYIGNSSWGYYVEYQFERVYTPLVGSDLWFSKKCNKGHNKGTQNACDICYEEQSQFRESQILLKINEGDTCKHGWNSIRGKPCEGCRLDLKILQANPNKCEHGWDMNRGLACGQCLHNYKMQYDSAYRANDYLKRMRIMMGDCAHSHICCETTFCDCCPEHLRKKSTTSFNQIQKQENPLCKHGFNQYSGSLCVQCEHEERMQNDSVYRATDSLRRLMKPNIKVVNTIYCKHGHDQNLGLACSQCLHEYRMSKDSTLKPYEDYFPKVTDSISRKITIDCNHSHLCCQSDCPCCPEEFRGSPSVFTENKEKLQSPDYPHSHDCCTFNCEYCPSLTKRERRKLIRKKKRIFRRNIRDGQRKGRKARRKRRKS